MRSLALVTVISISLGIAACSATLDGGGNDGPVGSAVARITQVPPMVGCVSISVVGGNRSVVRNFDVVPGQSAILRVGGLPVGLDAFSAAAYSVACSNIAGAQSNWESTAPFFANVSQGNLTSLTLTLAPSGSASIGINFDGDGGGGCNGDAGCVGGDGGVGDGGVFDLAPNFDGGGSGPDLAQPHDGGPIFG